MRPTDRFNIYANYRKPSGTALNQMPYSVLNRLGLSRYIQNLLNQIFTKVSDALTEVFGLFSQPTVKNMQFYGFSHGCSVWDNQNFGSASAMDNW